MVNVFVAFAPDAGGVKILVAPATVNPLFSVVVLFTVSPSAMYNPLTVLYCNFRSVPDKTHRSKILGTPADEVVVPLIAPPVLMVHDCVFALL